MMVLLVALFLILILSRIILILSLFSFLQPSIFSLSKARQKTAEKQVLQALTHALYFLFFPSIT
jgi:hypothetical protein